MDDSLLLFFLSALVTGFAFGYAIQRGGFCLVRALSNFVIMRDTTIVRAWGLAIVIAVIGVHVILAAGLVDIPVRPFRWVANIVGGLIFGVGMVLAGGCAGSTWYRLGEGGLGAWVILFGFAMGSTTIAVGALAPTRRLLQAQTLTLGDAAPTVYNVLGVSPWVVIVPAALVALWLLRRGPAEPEHGKWPWPLTGAVVGILIALGWWASIFGGSPTGITFAVNTGHLLTYPLVGYPTKVTWSMALLPGVALGSFVAAWRAGEFAWKLPAGWSIVKIFAGGVVMGMGGVLAEGCNITQGLTNAATLSIGSLVAFASMGLGGWLALWALYLRGNH